MVYYLIVLTIEKNHFIAYMQTTTTYSIHIERRMYCVMVHHIWLPYDQVSLFEMDHYT